MNGPLVRDSLASVSEAVADELRAAQSQPSHRHRLYNGRCVATTGTSALWSWEFDGDESLQPDINGELLIDGEEPAPATVVSVGDFEILLSTTDDLGTVVRSAEFVAQPLFILRALHARLDDARQRLLDSPLIEQLLDLVVIEEDEDDGEPRPSQPNEPEALDGGEEGPPPGDLSPEQLMAAEHATQDGLRFVWGPPGTGKTATIAAAVAALAWSGRRVMIVAHSNVAVDVVMTRVAEMLADSTLVHDGKVLRVGTPQLADVKAHPEVLPASIVLKRNPELGERLQHLEAERTRLAKLLHSADDHKPVLQQLEDVRRRWNSIRREIEAHEYELIANASIVGCTLAKTIIDGNLWSWPKDALVVDEASMAGIPYLVALAGESPRTMACFGDFRQLPPVVVAQTAAAKRWFGRDVFQVAGVVERIEAGEPDPRLAVLRTQYRMGETIAEGVSRVAYYSLLSSHVDAVERARGLCAVAPDSGREVVIVDTSTLGAMAAHEAGPQAFSRLNLQSAAVAACVAEVCSAAGRTVAAMSPYRAQVAVLHALTAGLPDVTAATMHRFQGSERDVVLVDLVDAPPMKGASRLTGKDSDLALRLLNVGISRARGKLVVLVDLDFLRATSTTASPALQFIDTFLELGAHVTSAADLLPGLGGKSVSWVGDKWSAIDELVGSGARALTLGLTEADGQELDLTDRVAALQDRVGALRVHTPMSGASRLEGHGLDLRLMPLAPSLAAYAPGVGLVAGTAHADDPVALMRGDAITATLRRLLDLEN